MDYIEDEIELAEVNFQIYCLESDIQSGKIPSDAHRGLLPHEVESKVNFAAISDETSRFGDTVSRSLNQYRAEFIALLAADLITYGSTQGVFDRLQTLPKAGLLTIAGMADLFATSRTEIRQDMLSLFSDAAVQVAQEASAQGVSLIPYDIPSDQAELAVNVQAQRLAQDPHVDALRAMTDAALTSPITQSAKDTIDIAVNAGRVMSKKSLVQYSREAGSSAIGLGRTQAITLAPLTPEIYASELLDTHTCVPCEKVDGKRYASEEDLRKDYPFGIYVNCQGGWACRGTPVYVFKNIAA